MAAGNIFVLLMNDGKQDALLNATDQLRIRIDKLWNTRIQTGLVEARTRFSAPTGDAKWKSDRELWLEDPIEYVSSLSQSVHSTMIELEKTHAVYIGKCYKPFVAMAYSYLKVSEKEGQSAFGKDVSFIIPHIGTWISDMVIHLKITGLRALDKNDKVRYCSRIGHRVIEQVKFLVNGVTIAEYGTEHMNKHLQMHIGADKRTAWLRNIGQEIPNIGYITPDPKNNEYREYRMFADGPQTFKYSQDEVDMYIPLLFWFNLDVAQSFPNCMVPKGNVKVQLQFANLEKLIVTADYGGGGKFIAPTISTCDLYVNHINTLPEIENFMMQDYVYSLIRIPKYFTQTIQNSEGSILLKDLKFPVEHFAVAFRPIENQYDADNWHKNTVLTPVDILQTGATVDALNQPNVVVNYATYYTEESTVDKVGVSVSGVELHPIDTVKKYSSFHPYAANGLVAGDDQGWLLFINQLYQQYNPSGHIDLSRNREIYISYTSSKINAQKPAQLIVDAQCINFLTIKNSSVNLKYYV